MTNLFDNMTSNALIQKIKIQDINLMVSVKITKSSNQDPSNFPVTQYCLHLSFKQELIPFNLITQTFKIHFL